MSHNNTVPLEGFTAYDCELSPDINENVGYVIFAVDVIKLIFAVTVDQGKL